MKILLTLAVLAGFFAIIPSDLSGADSRSQETIERGSSPLSGRELTALSLDNLLELRVEVVTRSLMPAREAPGIVTVVTREEIRSSGARDLIDVLSQVPGFHFGMDNQNFVGLGVRGIWAQEGKILLLVDGQEFNEPYYGCLEFGNHFPVDQIERIEIIRGPGSVMYGGYAELGVINIVTRGADNFQGANLAGTYGQTAQGFARRNVSGQFARTFFDGDLKMSTAVFLGEGRRSDRIYRDFTGNEFDMREGSALDPRWLNVGLEYRRLQLRFIYDGHELGMQDGMDTIVPPVRGTNTGYFGEARYSFRFGDAVTIVPKLQFRRSLPWRVTDTASPLFFDYTGDRYLAGLSGLYQPDASLKLMAGLEWTRDHGKMNDTREIGLQQPFQDGRTEVNYDNIALYAQLLYEGQPANLALGARYENHEIYGPSFVPRAAVTKSFGAAHLKLLYAKAFRAPSFLNISLSDDIKPENTTVLEAECGYQFNGLFSAAVNVFDITIDNPIVYFSEGGEEGYRNFGKTGSRGFEVAARFKHRRGRLNMTYSWYTPGDRNAVDLYVVEGHTEVLRAFPAHKATLDGVLQLSERFSMNPSAILTSDRYANTRGHVEYDADGNAVPVGEVGNAGSLFLVNLFFTCRDFGFKGLETGFGVFNVFDGKVEYLQPYDNAHAPLPGPSREYVLRLSYGFRWLAN